MIGVILAACLLSPLYDMSGEACTTANQEIECQCSECMTWDEVSTAEWYEINRTNQNGTTQFVGSTKAWNREEIPAGVDSVTGEPYPAIPATVSRLWCFAWDVSHPVVGERHIYRVRSCKSTSEPPCSAWNTDIDPSWRAVYVAAPYACFVDGREVPCYAGDALLGVVVPPDPDPDPTLAAVYISEVMYDQAATGQEFIELHATATVNLAGWTISDQDEWTYALNGPCFSLNAGDRVVIWQGAGTSVCTGALRKIFLNRATFLQRDGDNVTLKDAAGVCKDYVAFETGPSVNSAPPGCTWTGPNPTNGNVQGRSISRPNGGAWQ